MAWPWETMRFLGSRVNCLVRTPNFLVFQVHPYPDGKARPTKEIEEFAPKEVFAPYLTFK